MLARREAARVQIYGPGRIAAALADILTTSGVGLVTTCDDVRLPDAATATDADGAASAGSWRRGGRPVLPDLAVLVGYQQPELAGWLMRAGVAHLAVTAEEAIGIVGPMVRPGQTSCLRCLHLTRSELDPAWPLILAQLVGRDRQPARLRRVPGRRRRRSGRGPGAGVPRPRPGPRAPGERHPGTGPPRLAVAPPHLAPAPRLRLHPSPVSHRSLDFHSYPQRVVGIRSGLQSGYPRYR